MILPADEETSHGQNIHSQRFFKDRRFVNCRDGTAWYQQWSEKRKTTHCSIDLLPKTTNVLNAYPEVARRLKQYAEHHKQKFYADS